MSIFKRLFGDREETNNSLVSSFKPQNATIKTLGSNLQKRFSRGVQYNLKILIRGDRNVGKSALLNRLKGQDFIDQYIPTEQIEVACIHWSYKSSEDVVKVEVWDVVDKGRKKTISGLKLENSCSAEDAPAPHCLDAEFLDVYKGAHGVIIVLDMTKSWTFNYVERELSKLPEDLPVLVLANHRDMGHHRTISADQVMTLLEPLPGFKKGIIKYWESSMKNGYGLVYIHRFFNIPFLMLQRDTLMKQLLTNEYEIKSTLEGIDEFEESSEATYENFLKSIKSTKAVSMPEKPSTLNLHSSPTSQINSPTSPSSHKESMTPITDTCIRPPIHPPQARPIPGMDKLGLYPLPVPIENVNHLPSSSSEHSTTNNVQPTKKGSPKTDKKEIFDFVPDEQPELSTFLGETISSLSPTTVSYKIDSSSDEDNEPSDFDHSRINKRRNPMVAVIQDDIDEEDIAHESQIPNTHLNNDDLQPTLSSSDDEHDDQDAYTQKTNGNIIDNKREVSSVCDVTCNNDTADEPCIAPYSQIVFDATDLDILEQISSKKELNYDEITVDSRSSVKKKKKHHKQSEPKQSGTKKKKKKSSRKCDEDIESSGTSKHSRKLSKPALDDGANAVINGDSSDSLEKFLNE